jgi:DNA-binding NtrC family response regulator
MNILSDPNNIAETPGHGNKLKVLILDDEHQFTEELSEFFENFGFHAFVAHNGSDGLALLKKQDVDLMILDVRLPGVNGLDILKEVKLKYPSLEVIIVSAHGDMDTVIKAMRLGAIDYLRKPFRHIDIQIAIERSQKFLHLQQHIRQIEERNSLISKNLEERIERHFIGVSPQILEVLDLAMTASRFPDTNVLITGESGTGKENIARIIHFASSRKDNIMSTVNSSAITDSLMESEFFGHKKGSFTGAVTDKKGFFEVCDHGTLFLDEIADMPLSLQSKVLRAIEEKKIARVGDTDQISTDFRIISATNHELDQLVEEKKFRLDLLHRLNTLHIHIPPLRERPDDIEPLLFYFAEDFSRKINKTAPKIDKDVVRALKNYDFPGNVRELKNMTERAVILYKGKSLGVQDFPIKARTGKTAAGNDVAKLTLIENEIELIRSALNQCEFNQKSAAQLLGVSRDALIRKMKKYNIIIRRKED